MDSDIREMDSDIREMDTDIRETDTNIKEMETDIKEKCRDSEKVKIMSQESYDFDSEYKDLKEIKFFSVGRLNFLKLRSGDNGMREEFSAVLLGK
jgi:hypothetical protein